MQLQIVALEQRYDFSTKSVSNVLKAVLPTGRELAISVSEEEVQALLGAEPAVPSPADSDVNPFDTGEQVEAPSGIPHGMVAWRSLSDSSLAPWLKNELNNLGLPDLVPEAYLIDLLEKAPWLDRSSSQESTGMNGAPIGVEHGVSPPMRNIPRTHTIESDEAGNPIVPQRAAPSMRADDEDDDTGARSL